MYFIFFHKDLIVFARMSLADKHINSELIHPIFRYKFALGISCVDGVLRSCSFTYPKGYDTFLSRSLSLSLTHLTLTSFS